ncbi:MAG TPA: hypothetical protein VI873_04950, partial [Candidatus Peribacteraceae bacterium]|nr:hypothetical protein [Candidatus Peribacteraceae bacterium]
VELQTNKEPKATQGVARYCVLSESAKRMSAVLHRAGCYECKSEDTVSPKLAERVKGDCVD